MSIVTPGVRITHIILRHIDHNTSVFPLLSRLLSDLRLYLLLFLLLGILHYDISTRSRLHLLLFLVIVILLSTESGCSVHLLLDRLLAHKGKRLFLTDLDSMGDLLVLSHIDRSRWLVLSCSCSRNLELQHCVSAPTSRCLIIVSNRAIRLLRSVAFHAGFTF